MAKGVWFSDHHTHKILSQDKVWVNSSGKTLLVDYMDIGHKRNLLRYLERKCVLLAMSYFEAENKDLEDIPEDVVGWLHTTPLVARLIIDVGAEDGVLFP